MRIQEMRSGLQHLRKRSDAAPVDRILEMRMLLEPELVAVAERFERDIPTVDEAEMPETNTAKLELVRGGMDTESETICEAETDASVASELDETAWAVVSFDRTEVSRLTYAQAVFVLNELASQGTTGLCIITNEAAARIARS
jgi:hypothetical protein